MKTIYTAIFLISGLLLPALSSAQIAAVDQTSPSQVASLIADGALFVDVRETNEVEVLAYGLEEVINLPLSELPERLAELPRDRNIIIACRSGKRSMKAIALLHENDFDQLINLKGGIIAWETEGLAVAKQDRDLLVAPAGKKQCCAGKKGATAEQEACGKKGKSKAQGKSCCSGREE